MGFSGPLAAPKAGMAMLAAATVQSAALRLALNGSQSRSQQGSHRASLVGVKPLTLRVSAIPGKC